MLKKIILMIMVSAGLQFSASFGAAMESRVTIKPKKTRSLYLAHATVGQLRVVNGISFQIGYPYLYFEGCGQRVELSRPNDIDRVYSSHFKECKQCIVYRKWKLDQSVKEMLRSSQVDYFDPEVIEAWQQVKK